ncbi:hypothetical protein M426DRAFT_9621 [Hypoxylon sp. CI-4A]|nr:hypothetical protein M426DRAFT_9621 [Hypoxylon sp. CI-4A]
MADPGIFPPRFGMLGAYPIRYAPRPPPDPPLPPPPPLPPRPPLAQAEPPPAAQAGLHEVLGVNPFSTIEFRLWFAIIWEVLRLSFHTVGYNMVLFGNAIIAIYAEIITAHVNFARDVYNGLGELYVLLRPLADVDYVEMLQRVYDGSVHVVVLMTDTWDRELYNAAPFLVDNGAWMFKMLFWGFVLAYCLDIVGVPDVVPQPDPLTWEEEDAMGKFFEQALKNNPVRWRHTINGEVIRLTDWTTY